MISPSFFKKPSIARTSQTSPSFSATLRNRRKMFERKEFLEKYPDHELAPSVQFEIQWLGKDINDIPTLKHISS